jgi:DNA-binding CsgD family transcriptional regulator
MSVRIHGTDPLGAFPDLHTNPAFGYEEPESPSAILTPKRAPVGALPVVLTGREEEVVALVVQGIFNRQVASEFFLSEHTVKKHISKILCKLAFVSRAEIAAGQPNRGCSHSAPTSKPYAPSAPGLHPLQLNASAKPKNRCFHLRPKVSS